MDTLMKQVNIFPINHLVYRVGVNAKNITATDDTTQICQSNYATDLW